MELFRFIDWVLALPEELEEQLWAEIEQLEEEQQMHYIASFERKAHKRGMERGMEKGLEQGIEKGIGQGQARLLNLLIQQRFGALSAEVEARLQGATAEQLESWALRVLTASRLEDVFASGGESDLKPH